MSNIVQNTTTGVAVAGATSPLWLWDIMQQGALWATVGLPIVSILWIMIQIGWFVYSKYREVKGR